MTPAETLGYLACGLVLLTFGMRTMMAMRIVAIGSNLAFIAYGILLDRLVSAVPEQSHTSLGDHARLRRQEVQWPR